MRSARSVLIRLDPAAPLEAALRALRHLRRPAVLIRLAAVVAVGALIAGPVAADSVRQLPGRQPSSALAADPSPTDSELVGTLAPSSSTPVKVARPSRPAVQPVDLSVQWSGAGALGIPTIVLEAYQHAATLTATSDPACNLGWWVLAGIGHIESGQAEGGRVDAHGTTLGRILGPRLDGHLADNAVIHDTDHGVLDGDPLYDRAVGPLQFIPSTWRLWGADGDGDGNADPNNVFDAALAAAHYLCAGGRNLATPAGLRAAILSYNNSAEYLANVLAWAQAYRVGAFAVPDSPAPVVADVTAVRPPLTARPPLILLPHPRSTAPSARTTVPGGTSATSAPAPSGSRTAPSSAGCPTTAPPSTSNASTAPAPSADPSAASSTSTPASSAPAASPSTSASPAPSPSSPRCP